MKLAYLFYGNQPGENWQLVEQMGIRYTIAKLAPEITNDLPPWDYDSLSRSHVKYAEHGFNLIGLEGDQFNMNAIKFGLPGRETDIEKYCRMLENMGRLGITLLCYNFMAGIGWYRTNVALPERGGALVSGFNADEASNQPLTEFGEVPAEEIWENYAYFLTRVLPAAEKAGVKMAMHPDDPPVSPLRGIGRIFINAQATRRALALAASPSHGLTFCQGTYTTMGEDVKSLIQEFGSQNKIFFVHFRDITGTPHKFRETFHDNGPTNMADMFKAYKAIGYTGPIRSDHVPTMAGESNEHAGYEMKGNLFGIGYMKGLMEAVGIAVE